MLPTLSISAVRPKPVTPDNVPMDVEKQHVPDATGGIADGIIQPSLPSAAFLPPHLMQALWNLQMKMPHLDNTDFSHQYYETTGVSLPQIGDWRDYVVGLYWHQQAEQHHCPKAMADAATYELMPPQPSPNRGNNEHKVVVDEVSTMDSKVKSTEPTDSSHATLTFATIETASNYIYNEVDPHKLKFVDIKFIADNGKLASFAYLGRSKSRKCDRFALFVGLPPHVSTTAASGRDDTAMSAITKQQLASQSSYLDYYTYSPGKGVTPQTLVDAALQKKFLVPGDVLVSKNQEFAVAARDLWGGDPDISMGGHGVFVPRKKKGEYLMWYMYRGVLIFCVPIHARGQDPAFALMAKIGARAHAEHRHQFYDAAAAVEHAVSQEISAETMVDLYKCCGILNK